MTFTESWAARWGGHFVTYVSSPWNDDWNVEGEELSENRAGAVLNIAVQFRPRRHWPEIVNYPLPAHELAKELELA